MKFTLLPNPERVFSDNIEKHSQVLLPLLTMDLNDLDSNLSGVVHFILPFEPNDTVGSTFINVYQATHNNLSIFHAINYA